MAHKYADRLGWLIGPGGWRRPPKWMPVALDNGAYGAWEKKKPWNEDAFWDLLFEAHEYCKPLWAIVPDVVTDKDGTIERWHKFAPKIRDRFPDLPLAFAVQDGMTPEDVPEGVHMIFVGGSRDWKWDNLDMWKKCGRKFHVGRVNTVSQVLKCHHAGASSCDGTGWTRHSDRLDELEIALQKTAGNYPARIEILNRFGKAAR
jgi:hypothetical protein